MVSVYIRFKTLSTIELLTKSSYSKVNPCQQVSTCDDIPMLFIHGDSDDFVPPYMAYKNYDSKNGFKMIRIYKDAAHARSVVAHKEQYEKDLRNFLKKAVCNWRIGV